MIQFTDITQNLSFQKRHGIPDKDFGLEYATSIRPLYFWYEATDSVSSFSAIRVNQREEITDTIALSTDLISSDGSVHICDGLTNYATPLSCGLYYFLVNSKYQSEYFRVLSSLTTGSTGHEDIYISGLTFYDNIYTVPWRKRIGKPDIFLGIEYAENSTPLYFDYLSSDSVSSFKAIRVNNLGVDMDETDLTTSLISTGTHHICSGTKDYSSNLACGFYYYSVNGRYESELFRVIELGQGFFELLEGGYLQLLQGGYLKLLS